MQEVKLSLMPQEIYICLKYHVHRFSGGWWVQATRGGAQDAVVVKLTPNLNAVLFSTYLGGNADDAGFVLKINPVNGNIYVAGATSSPNFPGNKVGSIQPNFQGGAGDIDGYIAILSNDGSTLIRSTFLGTPAIDIIYGIQFDRNGFPYVMGITLGNWPVVNAAYVNAGLPNNLFQNCKQICRPMFIPLFMALPTVFPISLRWLSWLTDAKTFMYPAGEEGLTHVQVPVALIQRLQAHKACLLPLMR